MPPNSSELTDGFMRSAGSYELVLSSVFFALGGWLIDGWLGTTPFVTCIGVVLGFLGATASIFYRYRSQFAETAPNAGATVAPGSRQ